MSDMMAQQGLTVFMARYQSSSSDNLLASSSLDCIAFLCSYQTDRNLFFQPLRPSSTDIDSRLVLSVQSSTALHLLYVHDICAGHCPLLPCSRMRSGLRWQRGRMVCGGGRWQRGRMVCGGGRWQRSRMVLKMGTWRGRVAANAVICHKRG